MPPDEIEDLLEEEVEETEEIEEEEEEEKEEEVEEEEEEKKEEENEEGEGEKKEEKEEDEAGFEEVEELSGESASVDLSKLNKEFPGILKKYPELRETVERELQFRELFPKLGDASDSLRQSKTLKDLNKEIFQDGSLGNLLQTVKKQDSDSLNRIARSLPDELYKLDKQVYYQVAQPIVNEAIAAFAERVKKNPDEKIRDLGKNFVSAMAKFINGENLPDTAAQKEKDVEEKEKRYLNSKAEDANNYVGGKVIQALEKNLESKLADLSDFMKQSVKKEVLQKVDDVLRQDSVFQAKRGELWAVAKGANFAQSSLDTIVRSMLTQVKGILPRLRAEVLEKAGAKPTEKKVKKRIVVSSKEKPPSNKKEFAPKDYSKYSDEEILAL